MSDSEYWRRRGVPVGEYDFDEDEGFGPTLMPIALGLAAVLVVAAIVWAVVRVEHQTAPPAGVVAVSARTGTFAAADKPAPVQAIVGLTYGPDPVQRIDLYRPPGVRGRLPVLVYMHSGGWLSGARSDVPDFLLQEVTRLRVVVASVGYRLAGPHAVNPFPDAAYDVDRAVRWLDNYSAFLALDPTRVVLAGTSAGGHLAALVGAAPGVFTAPDLPPALAAIHPRVLGVFDAVGPSDLLAFGREHGLATGMVAEFLDCPGVGLVTCDAATVRAASIAPHLTSSAPPAFLVYGSKDTLVPASTQGAPLAAAWARARGDIQREPAQRGVWYELADDGHNVTQATINMAALEQWLSAVLGGHLR